VFDPGRERGFELLKQSLALMSIVPIALQLCQKMTLRPHALPASGNVHVGKLEMLAGYFPLG
jgi:hypothetical protein